MIGSLLVNKEKSFLKKRSWLNPNGHDDTGMYSISVSGHVWGLDASFDIWDCSRKISLSFYCTNEKDFKQRAQKIDNLIAGLQEMKEAIGKAYEYHIQVRERESE